jgi:hypothetical protein
MRASRCSCLVLLLLAVGTGDAAEVTVFRCQDANGKVSLQDVPCAGGQQQVERQMTRPRDAAPRPAPPPAAPPVAAAPPIPLPAASPPPPMFRCTDFDGAVRFSEEQRPSTRCVPLSVLGFDVRRSPQAAASCRWVSESCVRLDNINACRQFRTKLTQARSDALHAFSDTAAFRRSEVTRLQAVVRDSCS